MWHHHDLGHGAEGWPILGLMIWLIVSVDLVLLGVWLWQKIEKKK